MKKKQKRLVALLLALLIVISLLPSTDFAVGATAKPKLAKNSVSIVIGGTSKIKVKNTPKGSKITYKSAKKNIVSVSKKGDVKGLKSGTTKVTVLVKKNSKTIKLTYKVTVKKPKLSKSNLSVKLGNTAKLSVKNKPKKAKYTWQSSNPKVATVNKNGKVIAKAKGTANLKVKVKTAKKTYSLSCKATVISASDSSNDTTQTYTVTFDCNGGSSVASQTVDKNTLATRPIDPIRSGYTFDGWFTAANGGQKFDFNVVITSNITLYAHWNADTNSASLINFTTDEIYWIAGQNNNITFTVEGQNICSPIILCNDKKEQIAEMHDDGINGDITANDGTYTFVLTTMSDTAGTETYHASTENVYSNNIDVFYFEQPTENSVQKMQDIQTEINNIESNYIDDDGFISENSVNDAILAVKSYVKTLQNKGTVVNYEASNNGLVIKLSTGLSVYYTPNIDGVDSIGSDVSMTVITCQPCLNMYNNLNEYMILPDKATSAIGNTFNNYTYSSANNYDNSEVSLDQIKAFGANEIVLWHGHGGYTNSNHSFLMTGEDFNWNAWWRNITYWWDCVQNRIIVSSNGRVMITSKYINKYCSNMNNSFFYLAACQSGQDDVLANSFLNKGASAVIANTETIYTVYNLLMEYEVAHSLTQINPATKNYYTLSEALNSAKIKYGDNDSEWYSGNNPKNEVASPQIFGGLDANNYCLADRVHSYKVFESSDINSWDKAEAYCETIGGHLATITSQEENDYVYSIMIESGYTSAYFGLTDKETEGNWLWVTGEDVSYTNWHSGEPNAENSNEDYAMFYYKYTDRTWNDGDFVGGTAFICEWD